MQLPSIIYMLAVEIFCSLAKEELPLCPSDVSYLPQTLPMHCRMPRNVNYPMFPGMLPNFTFPPLPPVLQGLPSDKQPPQMSFPISPGLSRQPAMPMAMPMPMMHMPNSAPAHKLPVIVMPFYSPEGTKKLEESGHHKQKKKKRRNKKRKSRHHTETEPDTSGPGISSGTSGDESSADSDDGWWAGRRGGKRFREKHSHKRRKYRASAGSLQPVLQYVTKEGYVIYEKKISSNQATDWLQDKKNENVRDYNDPPQDHGEREEEAMQVDVEEDTKRSNTTAVDDNNRRKSRTFVNPLRRKSKKGSKN